MKNTIKRYSAFSLVELAVVILIIGIIIAGVTQGSRLISKSRFSNAKTLTQSSPVSSIKNLALWLDSTNDASFDDADTEDAALVNNWYDINPQTSTKVNFTATNTGRPAYTLNSSGSINSLPTVIFDGTSDFMQTSNFGNITTGASSVFMVVRTPASGSIAAGSAIFSRRATTGTATNIQVNIGSLTTGWQYCDGSATCYAPSALAISGNTAYVVSVVYTANSGSSTTSGVRFYQNGTYNSSIATTNNNPDLSVTTSTPTYVGKSGVSATPAYFTGGLGELIVFDRALKDEERISIQNYLGAKWGIKMN